jgi:hypothetical protein
VVVDTVRSHAFFAPVRDVLNRRKISELTHTLKFGETRESDKGPIKIQSTLRLTALCHGH